MKAHVVVMALLSAGAPLSAQVTIAPRTVEPAAWERFALRLVNVQPPALVRVRLEVPDAVTILGTQAPPGWRYAATAATDTTAQVVTWWGGTLPAGGFEEFAILGRVIGDARRRELVFPVTLTRADSTTLRWGRGSGDGEPPTVTIRGSTFITSWGAAALGGAALGLSALALAMVAFRKGASGGESGPDS